MPLELVLLTSYTVQVVLALVYGGALWGFSSLYRRAYLRDWSLAWFVLAIAIGASTFAYYFATYLPDDPRRVVFSSLALMLGYTFAALLVLGGRELTGRRRWTPRELGLIVLVSAVWAVGTVAFTARPGIEPLVRLFLRVTTYYTVIALALLHVGLLVLRMPTPGERFGRVVLGATLCAYGAKLLLNAALLVLPTTFTSLGPLLTVFDAVLIPCVGLGMIVSLLEFERQRAVRSAREVVAAQEALRHSEEQFRSLIENASDIITVLAADGSTLFAGPSTERILGWSAHELIGRSAFDFIHPGDADAARAAFRAVLEAPATANRVEIRLRRKQGDWLRFESLGRVHPTGGAPAIVVTFRDISERKQLEAELLQSQKMESIGRLAGGVAHDFNNILTAVLGHVSLARLGAPSDPNLHAELDDIQRAAERAAELTRQLLAFARRQVIEPTVLDLNERVEGMRRLLGRLIGEDVELRTDLTPGTWPVRADLAQLEQALVNLALNARDAMPHGGQLAISTSNVTLTGEQAPRDPVLVPGDYVRVVVSDTGLGMDEETRSRIFEPFFTTKGPSQGTGLGLSMVYGVVAQAGGAIEVESAPGAGARFIMHLTRYSGPAPAPAPAAEPRVVTPRRDATILLVEDEPQVRAVAARVLRAEGFDVLEAANGAEGISMAAAFKGRIHLVLTDMVMPGVSGPTMVRALVASRPEARVIFMTGFSADALAGRGGMPDGASPLQKPFTVEALLARVREELELQPNGGTPNGVAPEPG